MKTNNKIMNYQDSVSHVLEKFWGFIQLNAMFKVNHVNNSFRIIDKINSISWQLRYDPSRGYERKPELRFCPLTCIITIMNFSNLYEVNIILLFNDFIFFFINILISIHVYPNKNAEPTNWNGVQNWKNTKMSCGLPERFLLISEFFYLFVCRFEIR